MAESTSYHWTPAARGRFIDTLALTGSIARAAAAVGKSRGAAYKLRRRKSEAAFAAQWDAAVLVACEHIGDAMCDRALRPIEYVLIPNAHNGRRYWHRADPTLGRGLGASLVSRLDRSAAAIGRNPARRAAAMLHVPELFQAVLPTLGQ